MVLPFFQTPNFSEIKDHRKIEEKMQEVKNDRLKKSLKSFLKAYNEKNN